MEERQKLLMSSRGLKLPIGYRFHPTDEELVVHYLKRKVFSIPLPALVIPDFDVFQTDPWALPGEVKEKRYFFHKQRREINIMSKRIEAGSGHWKPIGKERLIVASEFNNQPVGIRKTRVFCGKNRPDNRYRWLMHEFHLVRPGPTPNSVQLISPMEMKEYWVVCGVFQKKRRSWKKNGIVSRPTTTNNKRKQIMTTEANRPYCSAGPPTPSFSSSSGITEVSTLINGNIDDDDDDQEESTSKLNISHSHDNI